MPICSSCGKRFVCDAPPKSCEDYSNPLKECRCDKCWVKDGWNEKHGTRFLKEDSKVIGGWRIQQ